MMLSPRNKTIRVLGLGATAPTPPEGITGPVIVLKNWDELKAHAGDVAGKIVVFNTVYDHDPPPGTSYRKFGPSRVAKLGAIAILIRSVTPFSIGTLHTGSSMYEPGVKKIPAAFVTVEDAMLLHRIYTQGEKLVITLNLQNADGGPSTSRNAMGDIKGREKPDTLVLNACHIDSWDVGEGAMDDGGGCIVSIEAANVMNHLKLRPRRTLRTTFFTAEEQGLIGADQYTKRHKGELDKINAIMESDWGTFRPSALEFSGTDLGACIVKEMISLMTRVNATLEMKHQDEVGGDTKKFTPLGVPAIALQTDEEKYMWFHHSDGDTFSVQDPDEMDLCLAVWTVATYVISDLSVDIPRK